MNAENEMQPLQVESNETNPQNTISRIINQGANAAKSIREGCHEDIQDIRSRPSNSNNLFWLAASAFLTGASIKDLTSDQTAQEDKAGLAIFSASMLALTGFNAYLAYRNNHQAPQNNNNTQEHLSHTQRLENSRANQVENDGFELV